MNHARARARAVVAQLRRQRPVAPQGDPGLNDLETPSYAVPAVDQACKRCGYLCCNCYTFTVPNIVVDARVPRGTAFIFTGRAVGFTFANDPAVPTPKFRAGDMVRILPSAIAVGIDRAHVGRETEVLKTGHTGECSIHIVKPDNPGDIWVARPMDLELVGF